MGTRVKGFFKGLKNISNIFDDDDEEEVEIQIGMPTDVKHVAHIGADGPAVESPSWMKEFDGKSQSGPKEEKAHIKKGTNNNHRISRSEELTIPEKPKTHRHRHHHSIDSDSDSQSSTRSKHTRRHRIRRSKDKGEQSSSKLPDIPKKSRRKKPKDDDVSVKSTQSQDTMSSCSEAPSDF